MNITKEQIDDLNAIIKVDIARDDYQDKVDTILKDYRKTANIPGFRKGHVPMGLVKKQYGTAVRVDEVNKILQDALGKYLREEKLDILGSPLPKNQEDFDWSVDDYCFEFELGMTPKFEINLNPEKAIVSYEIYAGDTMIENQLTTIQKEYGTLISQTEVAKDSEITGDFVNEKIDLANTATIEIAQLKGEENIDAFLGAKVGDVITVEAKNLFNDKQSYLNAFKSTEEEVKELNAEVAFTITEINVRELAEFDQDLFDKLYGKDAVKTVTELKEKMKEDASKQFQQQSDQQLMNAVTESLVEETKFDLPIDFLQKWIQSTEENPMTIEEAIEEYNRSEKGLRYQLIEGKIIEDNGLQVTFDELKEHSKYFIKEQMMQYGQMSPEDKELEDISARVLGDQEQVKRLSERVMNQKMLSFFKEKVNLKTKKVTFDEFVKEAYN